MGTVDQQKKEYILKLIKRNFQIGLEQYLYRRNLNTNIIAAFYTFLLDIQEFERYNDGLNKDFDEIFNILFEYYIHGIANKEGIEHLEKQFCK